MLPLCHANEIHNDVLTIQCQDNLFEEKICSQVKTKASHRILRGAFAFVLDFFKRNPDYRLLFDCFSFLKTLFSFVFFR